MTSCVSCISGSALITKTMHCERFISPIGITVIVPSNARSCNRISGIRVRASMVDSSSDFVRRMEQACHSDVHGCINFYPEQACALKVALRKQPRPIVCSSCNSKGHIECKWCGGTGFFIIGDIMLCEIPSRNTRCIICTGKGSICCSDCQGTGFRAKWLEEPTSK